MFTEKDKEQIEYQGLTSEDIAFQIDCFKKGFPPIKLIAPATPENGIRILSEEEEIRLVSVFETSLSTGLSALKFVPASGAASRMFKDLFSFVEKAKNDEDAEAIVNNSEFLSNFFSNIEKFAFYKDLAKATNNTKSKIALVNALLGNEGLGYGQLPKGQLAFHKYNDTFRTPMEEHMVESASYCTGSDGLSKVHFTVSPEHQEKF